MKKTTKKIFSSVLALMLAFGATACKGDSGSVSNSSTQNSQSSQIPSGNPVNAQLKFAAAEDKILQSYAGATMSEMKERFMGALKSDCAITAFKNEYETKQLVITPETDVASYNVTVGDFTFGSDKIPASAFDVRHMYYHEVSTIFDTQSTMLPGMYPDALLPMETAIAYGRNKIKAGENQGVYITVKVPKDVPAGVYTGTINVQLDGSKYAITATVSVLDYTLPDTVSMKSCIPTQPGYLFSGELDDTQEMYDKITASLKEFRLGNQYLESYYISSPSDIKHSNFVLDLATDKAVKATKDPSMPSYAIKCYEVADTVSGRTDFGYVLNTELLERSLKAYVDKSMEENVNLFEKAYVYMGNIIDEPDLGGQLAWDRANFVCRQYEQTVNKAVAYAQGVGAPEEVIKDLANLQNVVTGAYSTHLPEVTSYCPTIDKYESSTTRDDYAALRENGKDYWWYTCTVPKIPYPTYHIDDNGVSSRVMSWMAHEYDVTGYLTWESVYYKDYQEYANGVVPDVYGIECYDDIHRWGDAFGDGWLFYPGKVFGLDVPVPCMRLYNMRDGLEDFEAMTDLENIYAELSEKYGEEISADGVLEELYGLLYDDVKVYCSSEDVAKAKEVLGQLMVLAEDGIAVSSLKMLANGKVSAKVYAPKSASVTVANAATSSIANANVYTVNTALDTFSVKSGNTEFALATKVKTLSTPTDENRVTVHNSLQAEMKNGVTKAVNGSRLDVTMSALARSLRYKLDDNFVTKNTNSMQIYVYSSASKPVQVNVSLFNGTLMTSMDTIYLYPGENVIRFDRLGDNNWSRLKKVTHIIFGFTTTEEWTLSIENVAVK